MFHGDTERTQRFHPRNSLILEPPLSTGERMMSSPYYRQTTSSFYNTLEYTGGKNRQ